MIKLYQIHYFSVLIYLNIYIELTCPKAMKFLCENQN